MAIQNMTMRELFELGGIWAWLGLGIVIIVLLAVNRKYKKNITPSTPDNSQVAPAANLTTAPAAIVPTPPAAANNAVIAAISASVTEYRKNTNIDGVIIAAISAAVNEYRKNN